MSEAESGRSLKRIGVIAGVAAVAIAAGGIAMRSRSETRLADWTAAQTTPTVTVISPKAARTAGDLTLPANLQALRSAPIYARTNGYVRRWYVDIGDQVKAGQTLVVLDAPEIDQQVAAAQADLQTAIANRELAASTAARWTAMLAKDAVSKQETDEKVGDLRAKTAVANAARANVERLRFTQGFSRLAAPFAGTITSRSTEIGALVTSGIAAANPLFTVSDVSRMRAFVRVPQAYSARVRTGMHVGLTLPEYPGRRFDALLARSAGAVDPGSGTVLVELMAANPDKALKPGAYAKASFPLAGTGQGVSLPASALVVGENGTRVAVLRPDGKVELRTVTIGRDQGATVDIDAGLTTRDRVIDSPPDSIQTGDPVIVAKGVR